MESDNSKNQILKNLLEISQHNKYNEMKKSKMLTREKSDTKFQKIKLKLKVPSLKNFTTKDKILSKNNVFRISPIIKKQKTRNSVITHKTITYDSISNHSISNNNFNFNSEKDNNNQIEKENKLSLPKIISNGNDKEKKTLLNLSFSDFKYKKFKKTIAFNKSIDKNMNKTNKYITLSPSSVMPSPIKIKNYNSIYNNEDNRLSPKGILKKYEKLNTYKASHKHHHRNNKQYIKKQVTLDALKKTFNFSQIEEFSVKNKDLNFPNYPIPKTSTHEINNIIKSFAVNSYQGLLRNYNEDKVSIILTINKPKQSNIKDWPQCSLFAIYDGHGGSKCCDFLRDNLHNYIVKNEYFPNNPEEALKYAFSKAEKEFLENAIIEKEKSGSCSLVALIINDIIYIANCGDSRALISINNGKEFKLVNNIHRPSEESEKERIINNGGLIYDSNSIKRIIPGRLSVSRAIGDINAKIEQFGGKPNVLSAVPEIFKIYINQPNQKIDFLLLGCDGIFDYLCNKDCIKCVWNVVYDENNNYKNIHDISLNIVDMVIKTALRRRTLDNVTAVFISFENFEKIFFEEKNNKITIPSSEEKRKNHSMKFNQIHKSRNENIVNHSIQFSHDSDLLVKNKMDRTLILSS